MRCLVYAAGVFAMAAGGAEAFSLGPATGLSARASLGLRSASAVPAARLAKVARLDRKMGAARLGPLQMVAADAAQILSTKATNDASVFEKTYDMVILGGGPTGLTAALSAVAQGRKVVIVDNTPENRIPFATNLMAGGDGLPLTDYSTMTWRDALLKAGAAGAKDWTSIKQKINDLKAVNYNANIAAMEERGIPTVRANPFVEGKTPDGVYTVDCKGLSGAASGKLKAGKVLCAMGSKSVRVQGVTYDESKGVFDGDSIIDISYLPKKMTIVGNSLTVLEYAKAYSTFGTKVDLIIENRAAFDKALTRAQVSTDVASSVISQLESKGVTVSYEDSIVSVTGAANPESNSVKVNMSSGKTLESNALLTLMGRTANVADLGIDAPGVGVACNSEGSVLVDHNLETTSTGLYASGDVVGGPWMPNNGLDQVHSAVVSMFGLNTMATRTMPERHADFLAKSYNANGYAGMIDETFPGAVSEEAFCEFMTQVVGKHGFNPESSINLISTCRDEICRPFTEKLDSLWGQSFNIASLGGFVFCGKTGFGAGMAHAPIVDGKERYVFWVAPHIAYGIQHIAGRVFRPGRDGPSSACGALIALMGEISAAKLAVGLDPADTEMSLLRQQVLGKLQYGQVPNLVGITYASHDCILEQVKTTAEAVINPDKCEYVIISGIQIHGALNKNFIWPGTIKKYVGGVETDLTSDYQEAIKDWKLDAWLQSEALNQVRSNSKGGRLPAYLSDAKL